MPAARNLDEFRRIRSERLRVLELQIVGLGELNAPAHLLLERDDLQHELVEAERAMQPRVSRELLEAMDPVERHLYTVSVVMGLSDKVDSVEESVARLDQGQQDMQIAQGTYQDEEQQERHVRQRQNDRHFRRIYLWLIVFSLLFIADRIVYVFWSGV